MKGHFWFAAAVAATIATSATADGDPMEWLNSVTCQGMIDGMKRPDNTTMGNLQGMMDYFARVGAVSAYVAGFENGHTYAQIANGVELTEKPKFGPIVAQICKHRPDMKFTDAVLGASMM